MEKERKNEVIEENTVLLVRDNDIAFNYNNIDQIGTSFYDGIYTENGLEINKDVKVNITLDGIKFDVKIKTKKVLEELCEQFSNVFEGKTTETILFDPLDVANGKTRECGTDEHGWIMHEVCDDAEELEIAQMRHRISVFLKVNELLREEKTLEHILAATPKKKNGTLHLKRVTQIATLFGVEKDTTFYVLCAVAKKDTELLIEVRKRTIAYMEDTLNDVISISNLFRN